MAGLDWRDDQPFRNASKARIHREIDDSLRGLRRRVIAAGKIRAIGAATARRLLLRSSGHAALLPQ
jgi:hypothetical protein